MAVKIRLQRAGAHKAPFYRVVVADARAPRDGRFIELLGRYNPRTEPSTVELDVEKVKAWIAKGAEPSEVVGKLLKIAEGTTVAPSTEAKPSKKTLAKQAAEVVAKEKAKADAAAAKTEAAAAKVAAEEAPAEEAPAEAEEAPAEEAPAEEAVPEAVEAPAADAETPEGE